MDLLSYIKLLRPENILMLACGVGLGFWLSHAGGHLHILLMLMVAAGCAAGFGNVVNDIADIETDRISHPKRPLVSGKIAKKSAHAFSVVLAMSGAITAFFASWLHGIGTVAPLCLLLFYALFFKGTPLAGNILVSLLVAYGLVFGGMLGPELHRLYIPAVLAFLLNLPREIVKDIQDEKGDLAVGYITSAALPRSILKAIISICGVFYAVLVIIPFVCRDFGITYAIACLCTVVPLHLYWIFLLYRSDLKNSAGKISSLIKYEMLCGLAALALDEGISLLLR
jgi:geranylgeranylglycerol-phosphate geranylgeranyltransferase